MMPNVNTDLTLQRCPSCFAPPGVNCPCVAVAVEPTLSREPIDALQLDTDMRSLVQRLLRYWGGSAESMMLRAIRRAH